MVDIDHWLFWIGCDSSGKLYFFLNFFSFAVLIFHKICLSECWKNMQSLCFHCPPDYSFVPHFLCIHIEAFQKSRLWSFIICSYIFFYVYDLFSNLSQSNMQRLIKRELLKLVVLLPCWCFFEDMRMKLFAE